MAPKKGEALLPTPTPDFSEEAASKEEFKEDTRGPHLAENHSASVGATGCGTVAELVESDKTSTSLNPSAGKAFKVKGVKLLPHEDALVRSGHLLDITHNGSSSIWPQAVMRMSPLRAYALCTDPWATANMNTFHSMGSYQPHSPTKPL